MFDKNTITDTNTTEQGAIQLKGLTDDGRTWRVQINPTENELAENYGVTELANTLWTSEVVSTFNAMKADMNNVRD